MLFPWKSLIDRKEIIGYAIQLVAIIKSVY